MPVYEIDAGGETFEVDAPSMVRAESAARLWVAKRQMTKQAEEGATARNALSPGDQMRERMERLKTIDPERERELNMLVRSKEPGAAGNALALTGAIPMAAGLVTAPVAAGKMLLGGLAGSALGKEAGQWIGHRVPIVGGETAGTVLGTVGGLVGGGAGATMASKVTGRQLVNMATGGRFGPLLGAAERGAAGAPVSAATEKRLEIMAQRAATAAKDAESRRIKAVAFERKVTLAEQKAAEQLAKLDRAKAVATGQPETASPVVGATALAPEAISQADEIAAKIIQWKTRNKWSGAQIESALRNTYGITPKDGRQMVRMVMESQGPQGPLQASRIQIGAQNVGRSIGMTKEEVRKQAGPVLGEALGDASPVLPKKALQNIIDTMKGIPMSEREAYVARATSGKAKWQIENIRRTLEHLGLLLPLGAAGAATIPADRSN